MADISQELATIRTGIYGKDIRASIADAIELVNLDGGGGDGGGGTGSGFVEVADFAAYCALSDAIKYTVTPVAIKSLGMIIINRAIYSSPLETNTVAATLSLVAQIEAESESGTRPFLNMNSLVMYIRDNGLGQSSIYCNGVYYTPPDLSVYKPTTKLTQAQYDALVEAGTVDANTVYAIPEETT